MNVHKKLNGKKVLVTGGCGFIGINLVSELLQQGAKVTALDLPDANWSRLPNGATSIKRDILNKRGLDEIFSDVDIVYHLAARTDLEGKSLEDYHVNFEGTKNIIEEASRGKVKRLVFYSTQLVVGLFNETRFIDETEPYRTKTFYGESKIMAEKIVRKLGQEMGVPYTIIRPTSVYGPWGETPYKEFFKAIKNRRYFHIGKANNLVSWVYVDNLINLTILSSLSPEAENQTYFSNDFHPYTMREIVDTVADYYKIRIPTLPDFVITPVAYAFGALKLLGLKVPIYPFRLRNIKASYCYDIQKSIALGYNSEYDLKRGSRKRLIGMKIKN